MMSWLFRSPSREETDAMANLWTRNGLALRHAATAGLSLAPLLAMSLSGAAQAAWSSDGSARLDTVYEDNVYLAADNENSAIVTTANVQAEIRQATESSNVAAIAGLKYLNYGQVSNLSDEDEEFGSLRAWWSRERLRWGVNGTFRRDVLLNTVGFIGPVDPTGGADGGAGIDPNGDGVTDGTIDQGSVEEQVRRNRTQLIPFVTYDLSERTNASLRFGYSVLDYSNDELSQLTNNQIRRVALELVHRFSERDSMRGTVGAAKFDPKDATNTDTFDLTTGWEHRFSELAGASLDVGVSRTERNGNADTGALFRVRGFRRTEVGNFFGQVERRLYPNGTGELVETDRLVFGLKRSLSEVVDLSVTGDGYKTGSSGVNLNNANYRDYLSLGPELKWSLSRELAVGATYQFTWANRQSDEGNSSGNSIGIFVSYQPQHEI
jgi:hypothetical protein